MSSATASLLIEALRRRYAEEVGVDSLTDEDLAPHLPFKLRQLARWKRDEVDYFDKMVGMLAAAGWLNEPQIQAAARRAEKRRIQEAEVAAKALADDSRPPAQDKRRSGREKK